MIESAMILPTGDEIREGIVLDSDSPMVMEALLEYNPNMLVERRPPLRDVEEEVLDAICRSVEAGIGLVVLIGGSGGGHRHVAHFRKDYTHSAMEKALPYRYTREIYGYNGHMWSKTVVGEREGTLVINVPGPYSEARASIQAFVETLRGEERDPQRLADAMAMAVLRQYPEGGRIHEA